MDIEEYLEYFRENVGNVEKELSKINLINARFLSFRLWQDEKGLTRKNIKSWMKVALGRGISKESVREFHDRNVEVFTSMRPKEVLDMAQFFEAHAKDEVPLPDTYYPLPETPSVTTRIDRPYNLLSDPNMREVREAKILLIDIETTPNIIAAWGTYDTSALEVLHPSHLLCFSYKWWSPGDNSTPEVLGLTDYPETYEEDPRDHSKLAMKLWELYDEADIVVGHNVVKFDTKKIMAAVASSGLPKPSPFFQVDTLRAARRHFAFTSNKLNDLGQHLKLGKKLPHSGYSLWRGCMNNDPASWQTMRDYNVQDVSLLQSVYEFFLNGGWIDNHPNIANITGDLESCPKCGAHGSHLMKRGVRYTQTMAYQQVKCSACNSFSSVRKAGTGPVHHT